jgi:hypothetical protein
MNAELRRAPGQLAESNRRKTAWLKHKFVSILATELHLPGGANRANFTSKTYDSAIGPQPSDLSGAGTQQLARDPCTRRGGATGDKISDDTMMASFNMT